MALNGATPPRARAGQSLLYVAGWVLLAGGCLHVAVWLADGGPLDGPVSWRKPILFGLSGGVTLLSLGWALGVMRPKAGDDAVAGALAVAMLAEVGLITLQQWRGVPSHFNRATPLDASILNAIEGLIVMATAGAAYFTWRSFGPLHAGPDVALAVRGGMALLLFSCLLGFVLVAWGNYQLALGRPPETFGAAGVMKFPHGAPMHAIQLLPILAWLLWALGAPLPWRVLAVRYALAATVAFTAFCLLQTFSGRARFELSWSSAVVLLTSAALMAVPAWAVVRGAARLLLAGGPPPGPASPPH